MTAQTGVMIEEDSPQDTFICTLILPLCLIQYHLLFTYKVDIMIYTPVNTWPGMSFSDSHYLNNIMFVIKGLRQFMSGQGIGEPCVCPLKRESFHGVLSRFYQFTRAWQSDEDM